MTRYQDISGRRYGRLVAVRQVSSDGERPTVWLFRCDCGAEKELASTNVIQGSTRSCGCLRREVSGETQLRHGTARRGKKTSEYATWHNIRSRCYSPKNRSYADYGGRGIRVCDRWLNGDGKLSGYECFLADMKEKPTPRHTVERIDNDGPYSPDNCVWGIRRAQSRNKRTTIRVVFRGRDVALIDLCDELGLRYRRVADRMRKGWPLESALFLPPRQTTLTKS